MRAPTTKFPGAVVLGMFNGIECIQIHAVLAVAGETVRYHGPADAWDGSAEARAILLDLRIATKRQELNDRLEQRGTVHALGDLRAAPRRALPPPEGSGKVRPPRHFTRYRCLACGEVTGNMGTHGRFNHPGIGIETLRGEIVTDDAAPVVAAPAPALPTQATEPVAPPDAGKEADPKE